MREKKPYFVVTYYTTAEAMATEKLCKEKGIAGKLFSLPRSLSADCGIAWRTPIENMNLMKSELELAKIEVQGFYELEF